jgi:hypothetical protein
MFPPQQPDGDRDEARQKNHPGEHCDVIWRHAVHPNNGRRETLRICFDLELNSAYW